jgi:hypothetical protein
MNLNWEALSHFDPHSPDPFATHGIPLPNYGNYGGANYSAGEIGGHITGTSADPPPVDQLDALFISTIWCIRLQQTPSYGRPRTSVSSRVCTH